jgi:pSer/pThr/pTyr-binding forkhead associated (FHA) protein
MASIVVVKGPNEGDYYPLGRRTLVVGRAENLPIQIADEEVSRKHLQIRYDPATDRYHALDMKSANGVLVNGRRIDAEIELEEGDTIGIGGSLMAFSTKDFPDRTVAFEHYRRLGERGKPTMHHD